jgi:hypothetical protein
VFDLMISTVGAWHECRFEGAAAASFFEGGAFFCLLPWLPRPSPRGQVDRSIDPRSITGHYGRLNRLIDAVIHRLGHPKPAGRLGTGLLNSKQNTPLVVRLSTSGQRIYYSSTGGPSLKFFVHARFFIETDQGISIDFDRSASQCAVD